MLENKLKIKNIIRFAINVFRTPKGTIYKQELLLRKALAEKGFDVSNLNIRINHELGLSYVNNIEFGIKYPYSFYEKSTQLIPNNKTQNFYFNGNMNVSGQRQSLLKPFINFDESKIIESNDGRKTSNKDKFNVEYFREFSFSKYGLCPHHMDWPGDKDYLWTYRFIEACFVEAIPVLFINAPLSQNFTDGFYFLWDENILNNSKNIIYNKEKAIANRTLAKKVFCFTKIECEQIMNTIK